MISDMNKSIFNREYYSDLDKMIKHLEWILKFKSHLKYLTLSEIEESKFVIFRFAQIE